MTNEARGHRGHCVLARRSGLRPRSRAETALRGNPGRGNPGRSNPGRSNSGRSNPGRGNSGRSNSGRSNPGRSNPGRSNPGRGYIKRTFAHHRVTKALQRSDKACAAVL